MSDDIKRLYLSNDKKVAGVCGGIADYFNIDSTVIRLGWVVMTILTGVFPGVLAYFVAAIAMPKAPSNSNDTEEVSKSEDSGKKS